MRNELNSNRITFFSSRWETFTKIYDKLDFKVIVNRFQGFSSWSLLTFWASEFFFVLCMH